MNAQDTLIAILLTPGEIGVALLREIWSLPPGTDADWMIAAAFWLAVSAVVLKLR